MRCVFLIIITILLSSGASVFGDSIGNMYILHNCSEKENSISMDLGAVYDVSEYELEIQGHETADVNITVFVSNYSSKPPDGDLQYICNEYSVRQLKETFTLILLSCNYRGQQPAFIRGRHMTMTMECQSEAEFVYAEIDIVGCSRGSWDGDMSQYDGPVCNKTCHGCVEWDCRITDGYCYQGCNDGYHGRLCTSRCNEGCEWNTCHRDTGYCSYGCRPGYSGSTCDVQCHCDDILHCKDSMKCTGCKPGYGGALCSVLLPTLKEGIVIDYGRMRASAVRMSWYMWNVSEYGVRPDDYFLIKLICQSDSHVNASPQQYRFPVSSTNTNDDLLITVWLTGLQPSTQYKIKIIPIVIIEGKEYRGSPAADSEYFQTLDADTDDNIMKDTVLSEYVQIDETTNKDLIPNEETMTEQPNPEPNLKDINSEENNESLDTYKSTGLYAIIAIGGMLIGVLLTAIIVACVVKNRKSRKVSEPPSVEQLERNRAPVSRERTGDTVGVSRVSSCGYLNPVIYDHVNEYEEIPVEHFNQNEAGKVIEDENEAGKVMEDENEARKVMENGDDEDSVLKSLNDYEKLKMDYVNDNNGDMQDLTDVRTEKYNHETSDKQNENRTKTDAEDSDPILYDFGSQRIADREQTQNSTINYTYYI